MEGFFNTNCTLFILSYVAFQLEYYSVGGGGGGTGEFLIQGRLCKEKWHCMLETPRNFSIESQEEFVFS